MILFCAATLTVAAQNDFNNNEDSQFRPQTSNRANTDSLGSDKEIPKGIKVWTIDERFGDRTEATVDTLQHLYMNSTFNEGLYGQYNTLGNMGTARINRIFIDRRTQGNFMFTEPYDYCHENGIGFISFSPLAQGLLTDRYLNGIPADSRMAKEHFLKHSALTPELLEQLKQWNAEAGERGETLAEMALAWILHQKGVTSVLVGASSTAQLEKNMKCIHAKAF